MFLIILNYKESIEFVEKYLEEHRSFLDEGYRNDYFLFSGPKNPRTGGIIVAKVDDKDKLEKILINDQFYINAVADYEFIEFTPTKCHPLLAE